jgi:hypothetical protein
MNERELIMTCDACGEPIEDGNGRLWVNWAAVNEHRRAARAWTKDHEEEPGGAISFDVTAVIDYPSPVKWAAHHNGCDPEPDAASYAIDTKRLSTWADLAHWTSHLMGKAWLSATDWGKILEGVAEGNGPRLRPAVRSVLHA